MIIAIGKKTMLPINDYIFKRIFGHVGNEDITKDLVSAILSRKIEKINLDKNTILEKDFYDDKFGVLDIKAEIDDKIPCNIEMQIAGDKDIAKRILYYWSKMYTSGIKTGEEYKKIE